MSETINWEEWGPEAFQKARKAKQQIVLKLSTAADARDPLAGELADVVARRFVAILVEAEQRPDVFARHQAAVHGGASVLILSDDGSVLFPKNGEKDLEGGIRRFAASYEPKATPGDAAPAWTGAVGGPALKQLDEGYPARTLAGVKGLASPAAGTLEWRTESWRLLAYAGAEWKDAEALGKLGAELERFVNPKLEYSDVHSLSDLARLCWDLYALTGSAAHGERAAAYTKTLCEDLYDAKAGFFRSSTQEKTGASRYADVNAVAVLGLLRAAEFPNQHHCHEIAEHVLHQLRTKMYDPVLGMIHARTPKTVVYGLLQDNAWSLLAFTEAFLMTGHKPYREAADELGRLLFQEYWDRDGGGFLDRAPQHGDIGLMKEKLRPLDLNAVALEGIWRLSELKGNHNYKKWVRMALQSLSAQAGGAELHAGLARVQDMLARGRMDFELVGLLSDRKTDDLLAALSRHCLPRKIVSFVDPNDQDYIMAHKLEAPSYPRLFACGENLKRVADTDDPAKVKEVVSAVQQ